VRGCSGEPYAGEIPFGGRGGGKKGINGEAKGAELTGAEVGSYIRGRGLAADCLPPRNIPTKDTLRLCDCVLPACSLIPRVSFLFIR